MFLTYLVSSLQDDDQNIAKSIFSSLVPNNLPWTSLYWVFAVVLFLMVLLILSSKFPEVERQDDEKSGTWSSHKSLFKEKTIILYFLGIFAYVGTEQGVSYWMSKFLYTYHNYDPLTIGSNVVSWFWGLMSIGCILGLGLLKLFDSRKILIGAVSLAGLFLTIALFGPGNFAVVAFPLVGFSLSVMWSIIFSLALNSVKSHHGSFAGILCTAIIGGAVIQLVIGWLGDVFGLKVGMIFIYFTLAYIFSIGLWANPIVSNKTIQDN